MNRFIFIIFLLISSFTYAQHWKNIGNFNNAPRKFYTDTIANELYMGGTFSHFDLDTFAGIAKWNGVAMSTLGCGVEWDCVTKITPAYIQPVDGIIRYNNDIYVTGRFDKAGNKIVNGIARWDGTKWNSLGSGLKANDGQQGVGLGLKIINNELYVYGTFDSIAGIAANGLAKYNGTTWSNVYNFPVISDVYGNVDFVFDIEQYKNEFYVCGNFYNTTLNIYNIIKWNGVNWESVGQGIRGGIIGVNKMCIYKNELIVAGRFSKSDFLGNPGKNIAKWDGSQWSELGSGADDMIWDMKVHKDTLYVCGAFKTAGGIKADRIAKWDGSKWCGIGTSINAVLGTLEFYRDTLYIGGGFHTINGDSMNFIAKWTGGNYVDTCSSPAGINELNSQENDISIYPNPTSGNIMIKFNNYSKQNVLLQVYDNMGKLLNEKKIKDISLNNKHIINLSNYADGFYFIKVNLTDKVICKKVIKQN